MKKILLLAMVVLGAAVFSASGAEAKKSKMSLADARNLISAIVNGEKGVSMTAVMKDLSAEDQKQFLAEVNKAIGELPASVEERTAKYLNLNNEAVRAGKETGNIAPLLAETFATVAPEALTVINERFAVDLLNRSANPKETYTDEQFTKISTELIKVVNERVKETDNGSTRSTFAMLMMIRASNGSPVDLADKLVETLESDEAKELAKNEWIPAALGKDGREQGYEPILASADAGRRPDFGYVLVIAGPQFADVVLSDVLGKNSDPMAFMRTSTPMTDAAENPLRYQIPTFGGDVTDDIVHPEDFGPYAGQVL